MSTADRRRHSRIGCQFPAQLLLLFPNEPLRPFSALVLVSDVSREGVRVLCPHFSTDITRDRLRTGQSARLFLHNGPERALVQCHIVWVSDTTGPNESSCFELGLAYDKKDSSDNIRIEQFLNRGKATRLGRRMSVTPITGFDL